MTADQGEWNDTADGAGALSYACQWQTAPSNTPADVDVANISGETSATYTVKSADKGKYIRFKVGCSDGEGTTTVYSAWYLVQNTSPIITAGETASMSFIEDGAAKDITFSATDADTDALIWSVKTNGSLGIATISDSKVTYTPNANANGNDNFVVEVSDGTSSDSITVNVTITAVNDAPSFTKGADQAVSEDCGAQTVNAWASSISRGADNESAQTLSFTVINNNNSLFSVQPTVSATGVLTYTPTTNANGSATVSVSLADNGGTTNSGADTSAVQTFTITVNAVNDTPIFTKGADQTVTEDCGAKSVSAWAKDINIGPANESGQTYSFIVTTNNDALFSALPAIDTDGNLAYTPADNANGSATVTVSLKDSGGGADTSAAATFTVSVTAVNDTPTLTGDDSITTDEDVAYTYNFTVGDVEDAAGNLATTWDTSDTSLLTKAKMVLGGSGTNRTLTLSPVADLSGDLGFTITVKDSGGLSVTKTVDFTINAVNDAPVISTIADRTINEDTSSGAIGFAISDADSALGTCEVTVTSSNQAVVKDTDITLGGSGANRTIALSPVANSSGDTTITVTVDDKSGAANAASSASFNVKVNSVDDAPTIDDIADVSIDEEGTTGDILFTFSDVDDTNLTVSVSTDNTAMIPKANIVLTKVTDTSYKINVTPVTNKYGKATITVTVKDPSGLMATDSFDVTVNSVNDLPMLSAIADQTTNEDAAKAVSLTITDVETAGGSLTMSAESSSNTALIATGNITFSGSGTTRTMTLTPIAHAHGESTITVRATDSDGGIAERTFKLTVTSVNDAPVFTKGADKTETEDCGAKSYSGWATGISAGPADEVIGGQTVSFTVTNDNTALFGVQPAISADGTLSFTPADNANGSATVTVTLKDSANASSASQTFTVTISAVNDAPVAKDMTTTLDTDENQSYRGYLVGTDVDKDALTYSITSNPTHGTVTIINDKTGAFEYVPTAYFYGDDSFKFKVNDGTVDSGEATVTMKIIGVNDPPVVTGFIQSTNEDAAVTFDLDDHATDIDSVTLSYTVGTPDHGTITSLGNGQFSYAPNGNYFGSDYFTFTASDGNLSSNTAMVYVTVTQVNDAPTAIDEAISLSENQTLNGALKASDLEMNALTYSIISYPDETTVGKLTLFDVDKGTYTFVPVKNFRGTATFTYKATEKSTTEKHETGVGTVTITMKPINNAPEVTGAPPLTLVTDEDTAKSGNVTASDPDTGDTLTYSVVSYPKHGSLNATTPIDPLSGAYVYAPESNYYGTDFFTAKAVDAGGLHTSIVLVKITVNPVNDPCTDYNQTTETAYNTSVSGYLSGYDSDGDPLTYSLVNGTATNGTAMLNNASTGSFTFTPTTNFSGNASFQYQVSDGTVIATATVYVYVWGTGGGGSGYTLTGITDRETPEDTPITVTITATGLASLASMTATSSNATLLDDSGIVVTPKDGGSFDLTMTPKKDQTGRTVISLTFTYDTNKTLTRTFVLTVTPVNDDPTKNDKTITIDENKYVYDFVVAADVDDRSLTYTHTDPSHGTLTFNDDGSFKYEPTTNWYGTDSFTFTVKDAANKTASGTITINVVQIYRSPMANSASFETDEDTVYTADTDAKKLTAVDYNSESLKYVIVSNGSLGTAALDEDTGKFTYTPKTNLSGSDSFTFKVVGQTSGLESGVARVAVTVNPVNDAPVATVKNIETNEDQVVSGRLQASDVEGNTLSFVLTSAGTITSSGEEYTTATAFGTIKLNKTTGEYTYTPNKDKNGADAFTFKVADSGGAESAEYTVNITVAPINDAPAATNGAIEVDEDGSKTGSLSTFYSDVDTGDTHTFSLSQSPAKGTVVFNADGTYTYTPTANINGIDYFSFKVTDNGGLSSNVAQITVTIKPINDAPTMTSAATLTINEDSSANKFSFTVSDIEDAAGNLTVTGAATEAGKISAVSFSNSNGNCVMTVTPVAHFIGTATIRIIVTDSGKDGSLNPLDPKSVSQDVAVTVAAVNDLPTIGSLSKNALITDEDVTTEAVTFSIADEESPVSGLTFTGSSNNAALIKTVNITKGNDGNCSVTVTPQDNQYGTATVTVTVKDESNATRSANIAVTVNPVNDAPVVTPPTDQTINEDTGTEVLYYSISDIDSNVENIEMTALSSDNSKISSITLGGNGAERTVKVIPAKDAAGDVTITLTANDKATVNNLGTGSFVIHLTPVNDAPIIDSIADQMTDEDVDKNGVLVSVDDIDSDVSKLTLSGVSGNTALIKSSDITFTTDTDGKRYVNMKPVANANGNALITITVSDGTKTSSTSFKLTVNPINDPPEISAIADQTILEGAAPGVITFNVSDIDNDVTNLTITKASGDETVIPLTGIALSGTGGERTVKVTPLADQNGKIKVTLTVNDEGGLIDYSEFYVDITPVNDAPSFTSAGNPAAVNEDCGSVSVPWSTAISTGPANENGQSLSFVVSSVSNSALFSAQPAIAANGTLTFTPAANANSTSDVTVYLQDDGGTTNGGVNKTSSVTFTITVNPVNDKPTFTAPTTVTVNEDSVAYNAAWTTAMDKGPSNESSQSYSKFTVTYKSGTTGLFSAGPAVDTSGKLSFTPALNANGSAVYTVTLQDNGGTANGGIDTSDTFDLTITVNPVNDAPSFTKGINQTVLEDSVAAVVTGWATNIKTGPNNESAQTLTGFTVTNNNNSLFSAQPALATDGKLTFTPAASANGSATVTVTLKDDGGTANGGINTSAAQTFTITVTAVNDAPSFTKGADIFVNEDSGAYSNASTWATGLSKGASNESEQTLAFTATNNNNALFSVQPAIDANGKLTFTPAANAYGEANVTVTLKDNGGTANGGGDTSAAQTFKISVNPVNDAPSFTKGDDQTVLEDSTAAVVTGWATNIKTGPDNESAQTLDVFVVNNSNNTLFSVQPALSTDGKLTFTPAANANGSATVTVTLKDDGGTANGGIDTSAAQTFTITVTAVNDKPSFNKISEDPVTVEEDSTAYSAAWVSSMNMGPANESSQSCSKFTVTYKSGDAGLFSSGPAIDTNGKLSFTPASNANGSAVYSVTMTDSGGTANGGIDTSDSFDLTIAVNPVNDAPLFIMGTTTTTVLEDCGEQIVADWVTKTSIKPGPDNENAQTLDNFVVTNSNNTLFSVQPAIDTNGKLTFTPAANANGTATVTVMLKDNGGFANGGADSATKTCDINVTAVNDAPSFTKGADMTVGIGTGAKTYNGWATAFSKGPDNENAQTLSFILTTDKDEIFDVLPAIDSSGNLTFTPSATKNGTATVTVTMKDNGGTANGGVDNATATFTIRVLSASELKLTGTIYDAKTSAVIADATVNLLDMHGTLKSTVKTGADGSYAFDKLAVSKYIIEVIKTGYNDNSRITNVAFGAGVAGVVTEDFYMSDFKLVLTANPQKILGDGASKTMLTATVTDSDGKPISGIKLVFLSEKTTFSAEKTTDVNGQAQVEFTSEKLSGIDQLLIPIMVTVNDPVRKLYGSDWIYEYFVPGFVEGVVRDGNTNKPIKGATVTVYKDFDGDGTIDFSETVVTGDDGVYKIAVPKGKVDYDIKITKPVTIGDKTENITVDQAVSVGDITGSGTPSETYAPVISASGIAILANEDGSSSIVKDFSVASKISMEIVDSVGVSHALTPDSSGVFKATGLTAGATYTIDAIYTFDDGSKIVVGSSTITISATGEMNISQVLIDPYGTITDSASGKVIDGANVKLYYAKTAANIAAGKTPDTLVALPAVAGFPPANNANPQSSDSNGLYAFMVFPNTDYYIVAEKPGYATYTSPTIPVGLAIVNWDFKMTLVMYDDSSKAENDLAIEISSDKMKVEEGSSTSLTVTYKNKSADTISDYTITVTIPDGMTVADAAGGNVSGNTITWIGKDLAAGEIKSLKIVLTAPQLSAKEQSVTVKAEITSTVKLSNTEDDTSSLTFMLYSNRFDGSHKRYIRGYPDSTFGPSRNLTRAETAAIFARLLDLDVSSTATSYSDVDPALWSAGYIAAVSNYGLMKGYVDGSFLPENPITRAEFATIAARYFQIERSNSVVAIEEPFSDTGDCWAKSTIDEVYRCGIIKGYSDGTFKPNNSISRAEAVTMLNRMLYRGPVSTDKNLFTDISSSDWFYGQVMEASMSHSYMINSDATEAVTSWIEDEMK